MNDAIKLAIEALESIDVGYRSRAGNAEEVSFDEYKVEAALAALRSVEPDRNALYSAGIVYGMELAAEICEDVRLGQPGWTGPGNAPVLYAEDCGAAIRAKAQEKNP